VGAIGDVVQALIGSVPGLSAVVDSSTAPVPTVDSRPGTVTGLSSWAAPNASGRGQVSVHRDLLRNVAAGMHSDLADLDGAVSGLNGIRRGEGVSISSNSGLLAGWTTAVAFNVNASAAFSGVMRASQQTGTAHEDASGRLTTSAAAYDQSESDNQRAVRSVGTNLYSVTGLVASYGNGKPASSVLGSQPSYLVKAAAVSGFSGAGMSADNIMDILHSLSPDEVAAAGSAHSRLAEVLDMVAGRLATNAGTLAKGWSGSAAEAAMGQFQQLHTRMSTLAQQSKQVGSVLTWLGNSVLRQFAALPDPRTSLASLVVGGAETGVTTSGPTGAVIGAATGLIDGLDGEAQSAANTAAQQYIAKLSDYLVIANQSLPANIGAPPAVTKGNGSGSGANPAVPTVGSGPGTGSGTGLTNVSHLTTKTSTHSTKTTGSKGTTSVSPIKTVNITTKTSGQPGGTSTAPSTLQGATLPGGQLSTPSVSTSTLGSTSSASGPGGLTSGVPTPLPTVSGATASDAAGSALGATAETLDDTVPNVGGDSAGIAAETLNDTVPNAGLVGDDPAGMAADTLGDTVPNVGLVGGDSAGIAAETLSEDSVGMVSEPAVSVAPESSGLITELADDEPAGLPGVSAAGSPMAGDVIGGQATQLEAEDTPTAADGAGAASDDMGDFPMMGAGAGQSEEEERMRQSWLDEDDLWRPFANVVPPLI
jgi:hypothetical protein